MGGRADPGLTVIDGVALVLGMALGAVLWAGLRPVFSAPALQRRNHRGVTVPTAAGVVLVVAAVAVGAGVAVMRATGVLLGTWPHTGAAVVAAVGFGLLGLVDDLAGSRSGDGPDEARGLRGHLAAATRGRVTTGVVKLVVGPAVALAAVALLGRPGWGRLVADAAVVALAANLANLFDRAPGRTLKIGAAAAVALATAGAASGRHLPAAALVVGAGLALVPADLGERAMLGDTGANALGGVLGLATVVVLGPWTRGVILVALLALNLTSEVVSFSRVIDGVAPLQALDRLGRRH